MRTGPAGCVQVNAEMIQKGSSFRLKGSGLAVLTFSSVQDAQQCITRLDGMQIMNRQINVCSDRFV